MQPRQLSEHFMINLMKSIKFNFMDVKVNENSNDAVFYREPLKHLIEMLDSAYFCREWSKSVFGIQWMRSTANLMDDQFYGLSLFVVDRRDKSILSRLLPTQSNLFKQLFFFAQKIIYHQLALTETCRNTDKVLTADAIWPTNTYLSRS